MYPYLNIRSTRSHPSEEENRSKNCKCIKRPIYSSFLHLNLVLAGESCGLEAPFSRQRTNYKPYSNLQDFAFPVHTARMRNKTNLGSTNNTNSRLTK